MTRRAVPIVALDVGTADEAIALARAVADECRFFKVGLELFTAEGPDVIRRLRSELDADIFLDLKLHDIPNTVAGAVRSASSLGVRLLTVHASGGAGMLRAAQQAAAGRIDLLGVTVLTSMDAEALGQSWGRDVPSIEKEVVRLAALAIGAGMHGVVCSGHEGAAVRAAFGDRLALLVPGIRLPGGDAQDQRRVMTPRAAQDAGARYLILGRAVSGAERPSAAMARVRAELNGE